MMLGWRSSPATADSFRNRDVNWVSRANLGLRTLSATASDQPSRVAATTQANPPPPRTDWTA